MRNTIVFLLVFAIPVFSGAQNVGIGNTNPHALFSVGNQSQFTVDSTGNLTRINNVNVNFPAQQGRANTFLRNDGAGNLLWSRNLPLFSTILSPILSDSFAAYGYTLDGKINFPSYAQKGTPKTGEWTMTPTPVNPFPYTGSRSNIIYSPTYEEFSYYSNRYMYFYNVANNNWFQSTRLNIPGFDSLTFSEDIVASSTNIYILFGKVATTGKPSQFIKYDVVADSWALMPPLPDTIVSPALCADAGKVYVLGGGKYKLNGLFETVLTQTNKLFVFDINAGTWSTAATNLPYTYTPFKAASVLAANKIYVAGGYEGLDNNLKLSRFYTALDLTTYTHSVIAVSSFPMEFCDLNKDSLDNIWVSYKAGDDNVFFRNPAGTNSVIYEVPYVNGPRGTAFWKNGAMLYFNPQPDFLYRYNPDAGPLKEIFLPSYKKEFYLYYKN